MNRTREPIPDATLAALAHGLFAQGRRGGFAPDDYLRLVNMVLDLAMTEAGAPGVPNAIAAPGIGATPAPSADRVPPGSSVALPLVGATITIREPRPEDREAFRRWVDDVDGRWFLLARGTGQLLGVDEVLSDPTNRIGVIERDGRAIGALGFLQLDLGQRRAELRKLIGEGALRGRGIGTEATRMWLRYGARGLRLRKVHLYTLSSNRANVRLNQQLGFKVEGVLRREVQVDGADHDLLRMALVNDEEDAP